MTNTGVWQSARNYFLYYYHYIHHNFIFPVASIKNLTPGKLLLLRDLFAQIQVMSFYLVLIFK